MSKYKVRRDLCPGYVNPKAKRHKIPSLTPKSSTCNRYRLLRNYWWEKATKEPEKREKALQLWDYYDQQFRRVEGNQDLLFINESVLVWC